MSANGRRSKLFERLTELEDEFRTLLLEDVRRCAAGVWGIFRRNADLYESAELRERLAQLDGLADDIGSLRRQLGEPAELPLLTRYRDYCAMRGPNAPGEPKLAERFLAEFDTPTKG